MKIKGQFFRIKLIAICLGFIIAVYILLLLESQNKTSADSLRRTTHSASHGGYKALYLWLDKIGMPIKRFERSLNHLSEEAEVLMIAEPELGLGSSELDALKRWIEDGGTLIITEDMPRTLVTQFGIIPLSSEISMKPDSYANKLFFQPGPYTEGVGSIMSTGNYTFASTRPETIFPVSNETGGIVATVSIGRGRVVAISDPGIFSNIYLINADHSRLALNLFLAHLDGGYIYIDEYHHGYGRATSVFRHFTQSILLGPIIQAVFIFFLIWIAFGRRFGPPRSVKISEYHSSMEYIKAMAQLHKKAGTSAYALKGVAGRKKEEAKRLLIDRDESLQRSLKNASLAIKKGNMTDGELLHLTRQIYNAFEDALNRGPG